MKNAPIQPSLIPDEPLAVAAAANASARTGGGDVTTLDLTMGPDDARVHDTLCALQAPVGLTRLSEMMAAAGLRTERGSGFNPAEVKRVIDRLLAAGHATRDVQGRVRAALPHAQALQVRQRAAAEDHQPHRRGELLFFLETERVDAVEIDELAPGVEPGPRRLRRP
ncbi:MAG: hypothetical protein KGI87_09595, partial [Burkholderiales bacterium]|nr:hypothetical protein [Burkholderiales bacterium]